MTKSSLAEWLSLEVMLVSRSFKNGCKNVAELTGCRWGGGRRKAHGHSICGGTSDCEPHAGHGDASAGSGSRSSYHNCATVLICQFSIPARSRS